MGLTETVDSWFYFVSVPCYKIIQQRFPLGIYMSGDPGTDESLRGSIA